MKRFLMIIVLLCLSVPCLGYSQIHIFACEPEWAALSAEIAGDQAKIFQATTAFQDPHHIEARPALIARMRQADLAVCTGAELEVGWLPLLMRASGNQKVMQTGYFEAAMQVERLGIPIRLDRSQGDIHPQGNPHVHLDPRRLLEIARRLAVKLTEIDPKQAQVYQTNLAGFERRMQTWLDQQAQAIHQLKGMKVVSSHQSFNYLCDWLNLELVTTIEPKPGIPPSSADLKQLLAVFDKQQVNAILLSPYESDRAARWLAEKTGVPILRLPYTVGGSEAATDLFRLFEATLKQLQGANH